MNPWRLLGWILVGVVPGGIVYWLIQGIRRDNLYRRQRKQFEEDKARIRREIQEARSKMTR